MEKSVDAFRTISEVAEDVALPQHVLRFWETRFPQIRPLKRAGGRRYYRPADVVLLKTIRRLLYEEGYTIKGVQKLLKDRGARALGVGIPSPADLAEIGPSQVIAPEHVLAPGTASEIAAAEIAVAERPSAGEPALPESIRAALVTLGVTADSSRFRMSDLALIRESLATIDECERILASLKRTQA